MDKRHKLLKLLESKLSPEEKRLLQLISLETRKEKVVVRMPAGVITLEGLWLKIKTIAEENSLLVSRADTFATLEEFDDVLGNVEWLWRNWVPKGFVTLLAGDPGVGKTTEAIDWVRIVTNGLTWPNETIPFPESNVIWIDAESSQQILRERAISMGVKRSRVYVPVIDGDMLSQPDFGNEDHRAAILSLIQAKRPALLVLDSLGGSNRRGENKVEEVRPLMEYLATLARDYSLAVLVLHHLNKNSAGESPEISIYRLRGSTVIPAFCRSVIALEKGGEENSTRLKLRVIKSNLARIPEPLSLTFQYNKDGNIIGVSYTPYIPPPKKKTKKERCAEWIVSVLKSSREPLRLKDIILKGEALGFTRGIIYSAKELLGDSIVVKGTGREAFWEYYPDSTIDTESVELLKGVE